MAEQSYNPGDLQDYNPAADLASRMGPDYDQPIFPGMQEEIREVRLDDRGPTVVDTEDASIHDANLAEFMDEGDLDRLGSDLIEDFETNLESRREWEQSYERALEMLGFDRSDDYRSEPFEGASAIFYPLMAEASIEFQAKTMPEILPVDGPVKGKTLPQNASTEIRAQSDRIVRHMNYQITEEMPDYYDETDAMLIDYSLMGSAIKKTYWDELEFRPESRFVRAENFVIGYSQTTLASCPHYTEIFHEHKGLVNKKMRAGVWKDVELPDAPEIDMSQITNKVDRIEGMSRSPQYTKGWHTFLEHHVDLAISLDQDEEYDDDEDGELLPYIVVQDYYSHEIVSIRRNWKENDENRKKRLWYTHYKFIPWRGFYGIGFLQLIGGINEAATGALRALIDSAAFSNMQGGFRLKGGRASAKDIEVAPGEFPEIDVPTDDIKKAIMPLPFGEPSGVLFQLLGLMIETGRRFAKTADLQVGDGSNTGPVGTTLALLEQGSKVYSAIHKRLHRAQKQEFKLIYELNAEHLPETYSYNDLVGIDFIRQSDYTSGVQVIPVSDPNIFSNAQRMAMVQTVIQLAKSFPGKYDEYEINMRALKLMKVEDPDKLLPSPKEAFSGDPVTENMAMMKGSPIEARETDEHKAHMTVHMTWFQGLQPDMQKQLMPLFMAHMAEHQMWAYKLMIQKEMGLEYLPTPDFKDDEQMKTDVPPEIANRIAIMAAEASEKLRAKLQKEQPSKEDQQRQQQQQQDAVKIAEVKRKSAKDQMDYEIAKRDQDRRDRDSNVKNSIAQMKTKIQAAQAQSKMSADEARATKELIEMLDELQKSLLTPAQSRAEAIKEMLDEINEEQNIVNSETEINLNG